MAITTRSGQAAKRGALKRSRCFAWIAAALLLSGCADREEIAQSAMRVAEANYPGQLEVLEVRLLDQFRYRVTFGIKGDPITRFDLSLGADPAECGPGSECEARLRKAYAQGVLASSRLKALDRAFRACGVPLLAPDGMGQAFHVELDLGRTDQQPALDRLHDCTGRYWQQSGDKRPLHLRILLPQGQGAAGIPQPVTLQSRRSGARSKEPAYLLTVRENGPISPAALQIDPQFLRQPPVRERLRAIALDQLGRQRPGATLPHYMSFEGTRLDARRIDLVHTFVPACSRLPATGNGRCVPDLAVKLSYDLGTGEAGGVQVVGRPMAAGKTLPETQDREPADRWTHRPTREEP